MKMLIKKIIPILFYKRKARDRGLSMSFFEWVFFIINLHALSLHLPLGGVPLGRIFLSVEKNNK